MLLRKVTQRCEILMMPFQPLLVERKGLRKLKKRFMKMITIAFNNTFAKICELERAPVVALW
jgi:hypothetical protein